MRSGEARGVVDITAWDGHGGVFEQIMNWRGKREKRALALLLWAEPSETPGSET
jgi:hypothetical protein